MDMCYMKSQSMKHFFLEVSKVIGRDELTQREEFPHQNIKSQ
jgi:hypothetical protein